MTAFELRRTMLHVVAQKLSKLPFGLLITVSVSLAGCASQSSSAPDDPPAQPDDAIASEQFGSAEESASRAAGQTPRYEPAVYEATAEQLLAGRLSPQEAAEGWIRLFDGHTFFGWAIAGQANWRIEEETIVVDDGNPCLLTTNSQWADFEFQCEYLMEPDTNSGVFLRTVWQPTTEASDSIEINLAPADQSFPSGSLDRKQQSELQQPPEPGKWHTLNVVCRGNSVHVRIDGETSCQLETSELPRHGAIGLQYLSGRVAFRDLRLRKLDFKSLLDEELSQWKRYPEMEGEFRVGKGGGLIVDGGKQQLESREQYGDFTLMAEYQMNAPASNSGLFFRCIPGREMMGYECQINDEMIDGNPLQPADGGTGGIFRRQDARIIAGRTGEPNTVVLAVRGPSFASWVNGIQVADVTDTRSPDENPRRGLRLAPGTLMVQGHDAATWARYRQLAIAEFP